MMRSKTLWAAAGIAACFFVGTVAQAAQVTIAKPAAAVAKPAQPEKRVDANAATIGAAREVPGKTVEIWRAAAFGCTTEPSCSGPNHVLSFEVCDTGRPPRHAREGCYMCSLKEDVRNQVSCPLGFNYMELRNQYFICLSTCPSRCPRTPPFDDRPFGDPSPECITACPAASSLSSPCPDGFIFEAFSWESPSGVEHRELGYICMYPGVTNWRGRICGQCNDASLRQGPGTGPYAELEPWTTNGSIYCGPYLEDTPL